MRKVAKYWISVSVLCPMLLHASQSGFKVVAGDVSTPIHEGNACTIHSRSDAIIQWDSFSIDSDKLVRFAQNSSEASVLNRIVGSEQSALMGQLLSNGKVYVLNPNGVLIGPNAQIVASSFLASTLDVLDEEFLKLKEMRFFGPGDGAIVNLGTIKCPGGDIILLAKSVSNQGTLLAEGGYSGIGIGTEILIRPEGTQRIYIRTGEIADASKEGSALENSGVIKALATELRAGSNPYTKAIHCSGEIDATVVKEVGGQIHLVAEKGFTEVDGASLIANSDSGKGGTIHVLGENINVLGTSIHASGAAGGGEILLGGDLQGKNPNIQNAKHLYVSEDTLLVADAYNIGDGGKVISWSDTATWFYGSAYARGGNASGNGGIVEASGHYLDFQGYSNTLAPLGKVGTLLLDPSDITISAVADSNFTYPAISAPICAGVNTQYISITAPGAVNINNANLVTHLNTNCVIISTDAVGNGLGAGTITVAAAVAFGGGANPATTLTLQAAQNIVLNAGISCSSASSSSGINLIAGGISGLNTSPNNVIGINQAAVATISTNAGSIFIQGVGIGQTLGVPGVQVNGAITSTSGIITFQDCIGGSALNNNYGVQITATGSVNAPTILANNITGGPGSGVDYGFYVQGTLGTASTTTLTVTATSLGNSIGIYVDNGGIIQIGDAGTLRLYGTGTLGENSISLNDGIFFNSTATLAIGSATGATANLTGVGGGMLSGSHRGVNFNGILQMVGTSTLNFVNCHGGSGNTGSNIGVSFAPNVASSYGTTPTISFNHCVGGSGSAGGFGSNNIGVTVSGVTTPIASNATFAFFDITGGTSPIGSSGNHGALFSGLTVNTGSIILQDITGGGTSSVSQNIGVTINNGTSLIAPTITATDITGGPGTGQNYGFYVAGTLGSTSSTSITISAGSLGVGSNEYGIFVDNGGTIQIADAGTLQLIGTGSISGFTGTANQGIVFNSTSTLAVGAVTGATGNLTGIGGTGAGGSNDGVNFSGILNMAGTSTLNFINCYGGSGASSQNIGVAFAPNVASTYGTTPAISFNHCAGGSGLGGGPNNIGVTVSGVTTPLASNATFLFFDIAGGSFGAGGSGATFSGLTVNTGSIILLDVVGDGTPFTGNNNTGVTVEAGTTLTAPTIQAYNIVGVPGAVNDYGFFVQGTVGTAATTVLNIVATSVGNSANSIGIYVDNGGKIQIGDGGTLQLIGTGSFSELSPNANGNDGIFFNSTATLAIGSATGATANLTGVGGGVLFGSHRGVDFNGILQMVGTSTLNFVNCHGGTGPGGNNLGVAFAPNVASTYGTTPTISFNHCSGGSGGPNNIGVAVSGVTTPLASNATFTFFDIAGGSLGAGNSGATFSGLTVNTGSIILRDIIGGGIPFVNNLNTGVTVEAGTTLTAPSIQAYNIVGGPGTGNDYGFFVQGTVGTAATTTLNIVATSVGNSANSIGIYVDNGGTIQIGDGGTLQLIGTGSVSEEAPNGNDGIFFNSTATLAIGSTTGATANLTGVGGGLVFGNHIGVDFNGILQMVGASTLNFVNCHGGTGLFGNNVGVAFAPNVASTYGTTPTISFNHCSGGESTSISGNNVGVTVTGVTTPLASNATFTFFDIAGGISPIPGNSGMIFSNLTVNKGSITLQNITGGGTSASNLNTGITIANGTILTAPTIIANEIAGGPGSLSDFGFYIPGGTLGSASTTSITISASSLGTGSEEMGILVDAGGIIQIADTGMLQLTGTGSQVATGTGNQGIQFTATGTLDIGSAAGAATKLTGVGGTGTGDAVGVNFLGTLNMAGTSTLNFIDCHGGSGGTGSNIGVAFGPTVASTYGTTPTISFNHCSGGASVTFGINSGVTISNVTTPLASDATFSFFDIAGGTSPIGTSANNGVLFSGLTVNTGSITLQDITGGGTSASSQNFGVDVITGTSLIAPTITAIDVTGGPGTNNNYGFYVAGTLGSTSSTSITVSAGSLGLGSNEYGIFVDNGGTIQIADGGNLQLTGMASNNGSGINHGIFIDSTATLAIGSAAGATATLTGIGGTGAAGFNFGVDFLGILDMAGTSTLNFINCYGGSGNTGRNIGVGFSPNGASTYGTDPTISFSHCAGGAATFLGSNIGVSVTGVTTPLSSNATFNFFDIAGGGPSFGNSNNDGVLFSGLTVNTGSITLVDVAGGGSNFSTANHGVEISNGTTLTAPMISATGILGGPGSGTNIGWYVNGGTCAASTAISISAASAGLGAGEVGIQVDGGGVMETTGTGTITLNGLGGRGAGTAGYGIYVTGASSAITSVNGAISMTGAASTANTAGIQVDTAGVVNATGTGSLTLATPTPQPIALGNSTLSTNSGNLTLNGRINAIAATPTITSTSGTITFNEPFVLTATPPTVTATNGSIAFNSTVDGAFGFTPTAGTSITFAGALGSTTPLSSLTVTAPSIVVGANQTVNSSTTYSYIGAVTTTAPVTFTELGSAVLSFSSTITGNFPLTLLTSNSVAPVFVGGAINTSGVAAGASGGSLTVAAGGSVTFTGVINTAGSAVSAIQGGSGGDVTVHSLGSIITTDITVSGGAGTSSGGNSGSIFLQPNATSSTNATFGTVPNGTIEFNGAVITASGGLGPTAGNNGDIILAPLGRTSPMTVATMFTNPLALDSLTITGGNLIMGAHEALTVFNNATFTLTGYTALGDVVVLNNFSLTSGTVIIAPSNYLIPRASQLLLKNDGTFYTSPTPHVLSGGTFSLSGGVTPSGFNEGKPLAGITLAQLTFMGVPLNLDEPGVIPPPPPPPPPPTPSNTARGKQIRRLSVADAELNDLALLFVDPRAFWPYWSRMCCYTDKKVSYQLPRWAENCLGSSKKKRRPRCSDHPEIDCHEKRVIQFTPFLHRSDNI